MFKKGVMVVFMLFCAMLANAQGKHFFTFGYGYSPEVKPYLTNEFSNGVGPFFGGYSYSVTSWLEVGATVGYTHVNMPENPADLSSIRLQVKKYNNIMLLGIIDFVWLQKPYLKMYSGLGGGIDCRIQSGERGHYTSCYFASQITVLGISAGKQVYGNLELGYGNLEMIRLGIGYKLQKK